VTLGFQRVSMGLIIGASIFAMILAPKWCCERPHEGFISVLADIMWLGCANAFVGNTSGLEMTDFG
jgi:hypothetical protein